MSLNKQMHLSQSELHSQRVGEVQWLRPKRKGNSKPAVAQLTLTSLVDCFTILVVYLLVVTNVGSLDVPIAKDIKLPVAKFSSNPKLSTIVSFVKGQYVIDKKVVASKDLSDRLKELRDLDPSKALLVLADRTADYESLNPIVLSGLQAGYEKVGFAVKQEDMN